MHTNCTKWNLSVNTENTKIVVFRNIAKLSSKEKWIYNNVFVAVVIAVVVVIIVVAVVVVIIVAAAVVVAIIVIAAVVVIVVAVAIVVIVVVVVIIVVVVVVIIVVAVVVVIIVAAAAVVAAVLTTTCTQFTYCQQDGDRTHQSTHLKPEVLHRDSSNHWSSEHADKNNNSIMTSSAIQ